MRLVVLLVVLFLLSPLTLLAASAEVPVTGQTTSYAIGDDGYLQAGVATADPRFTEIGDGTVADNLTGLVWSQNASTLTVSTCTGGLMTWQESLDYVACLNSESYLGYSDWVLPNINELGSLVDFSQNDPALSAGHPFTGVHFGSIEYSGYLMWPTYWSSSSDASSAKTIGFDAGDVDGNDKDYGLNYVWPVRRGQSSLAIVLPKTGQTFSYAPGDDGDLQRGAAWPSPRFTDNNNGTVTDNLTGLIWLKNADCFNLQTWNSALTSANSLANADCGLSDGSVAGDWRLPNIRELGSLVDSTQSNPALPVEHLFADVPDTQGAQLFYWTSNTFAGNTDKAWFNYLDLNVTWMFDKTSDLYVWPVRGEQSTLPLKAPMLSTTTNGVDLTVSWTSIPEATGYELYYVPVASYTGPESVRSIDLGASTTFSYTLWDGASFYLAVKAYNDQESSSYSNVEVVTIEVVPVPPTAPELSITTTGLNLSLSWAAVPDATGYIMSYAPSSSYTGPESFITKDMGGETTFAAVLWDGADFTVAVQAYNEQGNSGYSDIGHFVIQEPSPISSYNLPETGQTSCYDTAGTVINCAGTGQDGEFNINPMSFTNNGNGTVTDNVTGLIWQQSDDEQTRTWQAAIDYCSSYSPDGSSWRLPSVSELQTIVDAGTYSPAINAVFTGTNESVYWSSTSLASNPDYAWYVVFSYGYVKYYNNTNNGYARCVR